MKKNASILITEIFKDKSVFLDIGFSKLESEVFYYLIKGNTLIEIADKLKIPLNSIRRIKDRRFHLIPVFIRRQLSYLNASNLEEINKTLVKFDILIKGYLDHLNYHHLNRINELNLSSRTVNALFAGNIKTVQELSEITVQELRKFKNLGNKSIIEIENELSKLGLSLNTT